MRYDKIPESTFSQMQLGAGVLLYSFDPETGNTPMEDIIGATSGGVSFEATPNYVDFGDGIDNCPANMKELKRLDYWDAKMSGSFVTVNEKVVRALLGSATSAGGKINPTNELKAEDFKDVWWVGDYSDDNSESTGGHIAVHLLNSLSTGGFKVKSESDGKGSFDFEFTGHYSMEDQTKVPFEVYIGAGK